MVVTVAGVSLFGFSSRVATTFTASKVFLSFGFAGIWLWASEDPDIATQTAKANGLTTVLFCAFLQTNWYFFEVFIDEFPRCKDFWLATSCTLVDEHQGILAG